MSEFNGHDYAILGKRLFGATTYIAVSQVAITVINFGVVALLTRHTSLHNLGIYLILIQIGRIGGIFCQAGTAQSSQKFLGRVAYSAPWALPLIQRKIMIVLLAATLLTIGITAAAWNILAELVFHNKGITGLAFFGCIAIIVVTLQNYQSAVLRAVDRMLQSVLSLGLIQKSLLLIGIVLLLLLGKTSSLSLESILWVWVISGLSSAFIGTVFVWRMMAKLRKHEIYDTEVKLPDFKEIVFTSLPMAIGGGMGTLRNSVDIVIVGAVLGPASAGVYGICRMLGKLILFVGESVNRALPATVAAAYNKLPLRDVEVLCRKGASYGAFIAVPGAVILIVAGGPILHLAFGPRLDGYWLILAILVAGPLVKALLGAPNSILSVCGYHKLAMMVNVGTTLFAIISMPFIAGKFGLVGVAVFSSGLMVIQFAWMSYFTYRRLGLRTYAGFPGRYIPKGV